MVETVQEKTAFPALLPIQAELLQKVQDEYLGDAAWDAQPVALEQFDGAYIAKFMPQTDKKQFKTVMKWKHKGVTMEKFTERYWNKYQEMNALFDKTITYKDLPEQASADGLVPTYIHAKMPMMTFMKNRCAIVQIYKIDDPANKRKIIMTTS